MNNYFSLRLKNLRKNMGYTQKDFAKLLNIGQTTIANYENGTRVPDISKIAEIADLFNVSIDYLYGRDDELSEKYPLSFDKGINYSDSNYNDYMISLINGDKETAIQIAISFIKSSMDLRRFYKDIVLRSLIETGVLWEKGVVDVWKEHFITEITIDIMKLLKTKFVQKNRKDRSILALTPGPEMHSIGLRMVCDIFDVEGWNVIFLGSNVPTESVLSAIKEKKPDVVALSVTLSYHTESARLLIEAIKEVYINDCPLIIIGGSALKHLENILESTGADFYFESFEDLDLFLTQYEFKI